MVFQQTAAPLVFPAAVSQHSVTFDPDAPTNWSRHCVRYAASERIRQAAPKRQAAFCAGRHCAREALRTCLPDQEEWPLQSGPNGEPLWPAGIVGSITHSGGFASAAVARRSQARGIGMDHERLMTSHAAAELMSFVGNPAEVHHLASATAWPLGLVVTLIFSAKESLFKCLYPEVRRYFDFLDASIDEVDRNQHRFRVRLLSTLTPDLPAGLVLVGRFELQQSSLSTGLLLPL